MKKFRMYYFTPVIAIALLGLSSCTSNTAKADNQEVQVMDSVSKDLEQTKSDLEDQTKKVEASLEKLDKELANAK